MESWAQATREGRHQNDLAMAARKQLANGESTALLRRKGTDNYESMCMLRVIDKAGAVCGGPMMLDWSE